MAGAAAIVPLGAPSGAEWASVARSVLADRLADRQLSAGAERRIAALLARHEAAELGLSDLPAERGPPMIDRLSPSVPAGERLATLETKIEAVERRQSEILDKIDDMTSALAQANGGMKVLIWLGGLLGVGGIAHLLNSLGIFHLPPPGK